MTQLDLIRDINQVLPLLAAPLLAWRAVVSWPAHWARPDHVVHYRTALVLITGYVVLTSMGALAYDDAPVTPVSIGFLAQTVIVLVWCWRWPRPHILRRDDDR